MNIYHVDLFAGLNLVDLNRQRNESTVNTKSILSEQTIRQTFREEQTSWDGTGLFVGIL